MSLETPTTNIPSSPEVQSLLIDCQLELGLFISLGSLGSLSIGGNVHHLLDSVELDSNSTGNLKTFLKGVFPRPAHTCVVHRRV